MRLFHTLSHEYATHPPNNAVLQQLSSRHIAMMQPKTEPTPEPSTSTEAPTPTGPPVNYLTIPVLPEAPGSGYPSPALSPLADPSTSGSQPPRPMRAIDPTVTFISRSTLNAYASVRVLREGRTIWTEKTTLRYLESRVLPAPVYPAQMECTHLYSTEVVPGFWSQLCDCGSEYSSSCPVWAGWILAVECQELTHILVVSDPTPFTIVQDIVRLPGGVDAASVLSQTGTSAVAREDVVLSTVYRFKMHPTTSPPLSPSMSSVDALSYSHESSVSQLPPYMQGVMLTDSSDFSTSI